MKVKIIEMFICGETVYLVKEIAKQGNLYDIINSLYTATRGGLDEFHSELIFRQIVEGIIYLHDNHIVHRFKSFSFSNFIFIFFKEFES